MSKLKEAIDSVIYVWLKDKRDSVDQAEQPFVWAKLDNIMHNDLAIKNLRELIYNRLMAHLES